MIWAFGPINTQIHFTPEIPFFRETSSRTPLIWSINSAVGSIDLFLDVED